MDSPASHPAPATAPRPLPLRRWEAPATPVILVPGLRGSGPAHWQGWWARTLPGAEMLDQGDWDRPRLADWAASLAEALRRRPGAVVVAHSLGCALVAHYARISGGRRIAGALMVAPADVDTASPWLRGLDSFSPMPRERLGFPSRVVASRNDPYVRLERARRFAEDWGADFHDLGEAGHINVASGHGPWPVGLALLDDLVRVEADPSRGASRAFG